MSPEAVTLHWLIPQHRLLSFQKKKHKFKTPYNSHGPMTKK